MRDASAAASPFVLLCKTFLAQFGTSESVTSDVELRRTLLWVLAFVLTPGLMLIVAVFPSYDVTVIVARKLHKPELIDPMLRYLACVLICYSMVTVGAIATFAWDALAFDLRDAVVLGPLPVPRATIVAAKLAALTLFLLGVGLGLNLFNSVLFAVATSDRDGLVALMTHFMALLAATMAGTTFVFAALVTIRGAVALVRSSRVSAALGSLLQFAFVGALLCFVVIVVSSNSSRLPLTDARIAAWMPPLWFLGLFERLVGLSQPAFPELAKWAVPGALVAGLAAVVVSLIGFRRQMQRALEPAASAAALGTVRLTRRLARLLSGRDATAKATADFMLLTLARCRAQQAPIALNAAIGLMLVVAGLSRTGGDLASLARPRTAILWIPSLLAYWMTIGLRAAFFVPSDLDASWSFRTNAPDGTVAYWSAVRATVLAVVMPPVVAVTMLMAALVGWRAAAAQGLIACGVLVLLAELVGLTVNFIPFTRAYAPGHARLKTHWWIYLLGVYVLAYWPARVGLAVQSLPDLTVALVCLGAVITFVHLAGRRRATGWQLYPPAQDDNELSGATVLNIGGTVRGT